MAKNKTTSTVTRIDKKGNFTITDRNRKVIRSRKIIEFDGETFINDKQSSKDNDKKNSKGSSILTIVFLILVIALLFRYTVANGNTNEFALPTFRSLLEFLTHPPVVQIPFISESLIVLGDWGVFNWFRDFIGMLIPIINVLLFIVNSMLSVVEYVVYFVGWLFSV